MKQLNFKIEKNATEAKSYIEFESMIEFLKDVSKHHFKMYMYWYEMTEDAENQEQIDDCIKFEDAALERSCEIDHLERLITEQFIEFTKEVNENGFK